MVGGSILFAGSPLAVDIENADIEDHTVAIVNGDGTSEKVLVPNGGVASNVCKSCQISRGQSVIEASEDEVVTIANGELTQE